MTTERSPAQDELLAQLLALGFDLPRCQQAITRGFNSVDEAAAFILDIESGAMQVDPHDLHRGPVLALNPLRSTDSTPPRFPDQSTSSSDPSPELKSRYKESRADYFDLAAKKELELAIKRKANDKDSKRRVLEQIREDREKQRLKRAAERGELPEPPQVQQSTSAQPASTKSATTAQPPSSFENTTATIQIRLPSGRALRTRLPASTKLGLIFEYVASETSAPGTLHVDRVAGAAKTGRGLLLAFPKRLFAEESSDADLTIGEAGLAPSASLNLVKAAPPEQPPPPPAELLPNTLPRQSASEEDSPASEPSQREDSEMAEDGESEDESTEGDETVRALPFPFPRAPLGGDGGGAGSWGRGQRISDTHANPAPPEPENPPAVPRPAPPRVRPGGPGWPGRGRPNPFPPNPHPFGPAPPFGVLPPFAGPSHRVRNEPERQQAAADSMDIVEASVTRASRLDAISRAAANIAPSPQPSPKSIKVVREPPKLLDLTMHCVAGLITNPEVPSKVLSKLKYVGTDLAERMVQTLMSKRLLDSYSLGRMHSCPLSVLNMDAYPLMTDSLLEKIITLHWTTLSKLSLRSCTYLTDVGFSGIQHCRTLTHLDVSSCKVTDAIVPFIAGLQCLEHLNLSRTKISSDGVRAIAKGSSGTISELILSHCVNLTDNTLLVDLQVLSNLAILNISSSHVKAPFIPPPATAFRALEVFEAAHTNITDDDLRCFVSGLSMLRVFDVSSSRSVTSAGLRWVCSSCANLSTLKVAPIEPEADAAVARVLLVVGSKKKLPLEALDLAGFSVTDEALGETLSGFNETLMVLRLSGNKITDEGLSHLKDLKNLTELYLDRTLITDAIFSHIKDLRHLEVLSLAETGVTDAFLRKMGTGDICKSLKRLNLARTVVSDEGIAGLPAMEQLAAITLDQTEVTAAASGPTLWDVRKFPLLKQVRFPVVVATPENPDGDEEDGDGGF